jgi:hypothetical protein
MNVIRTIQALALTAALAMGAMQAGAAGEKAIQPGAAAANFTTLPGVSKVKPGTYCCSGTQCTQVNLLTVCAGGNNIRWSCTGESCAREPFGGDN